MTTFFFDSDPHGTFRLCINFSEKLLAFIIGFKIFQKSGCSHFKKNRRQHCHQQLSSCYCHQLSISSWLIYGNAVARVDRESSAGLATAVSPFPFLEILWTFPHLGLSRNKVQCPQNPVVVCDGLLWFLMFDHGWSYAYHSPWWFIIVYHHFPGFLKSDIAVLTSSPCGSRPHRNTWEPLGSPHHCRTPRCSACGNGICDAFSIRMKRLVSPLALLAAKVLDLWISGAWSWSFWSFHSRNFLLIPSPYPTAPSVPNRWSQVPQGPTGSHTTCHGQSLVLPAPSVSPGISANLMQDIIGTMGI